MHSNHWGISINASTAPWLERMMLRGASTLHQDIGFDMTRRLEWTDVCSLRCAWPIGNMLKHLWFSSLPSSLFSIYFNMHRELYGPNYNRLAVAMKLSHTRNYAGVTDTSATMTKLWALILFTDSKRIELMELMMDVTTLCPYLSSHGAWVYATEACVS